MTMGWSTVWEVVRHDLRGAADLVLPARCAACHAPAAGPLCRTCADAVRSAARGVEPAAVGPRRPPAMPSCWAGARFEGALRLAVTAYKDEGRRDLRDELARLLAAALSAAADDPAVRRPLRLGEEVLVVPVPPGRSSRRRRGDDPVGALAVAATAAANGLVQGAPGSRSRGPMVLVERRRSGLVVVPALVHTRRVADQAQLDRRARARNLAGSMVVGASWRAVARGATCIVVDDVVTTGSTLGEAARALHDAGARHVVAATCATTPFQGPTPPLWPTDPPTSVRT